MSHQNKYKPLSPPQRIREYFALRINGPSPPPTISPPRPYVIVSTPSPRRTTTGFRQAHKNGPRSDGEILWAMIKARRANKKAKPSRIPRPKQIKAEKGNVEQGIEEGEVQNYRPLTPLNFADQMGEVSRGDEKLLESQQGKRASRIPLPARLYAEPQSAVVDYKPSSPSISMALLFGFKSRSKTAAQATPTGESPPTDSVTKIPTTRQKPHLDPVNTTYTGTPSDSESQSPAPDDADVHTNLVNSRNVAFHPNSHQRESMRAEVFDSPTPSSIDSPISSKKSKTQKPARVTRFVDFLRLPKTPISTKRRQPWSGISTDSDESFQCVGIIPDVPPKEAPPVPVKDTRYKPPRLPLQVSSYGVPSDEEDKGKARETREWSPYHVPSNPFDDEVQADYEMSYERWFRTQQLSQHDDKALNSAGTFRLTDGSWGETLLPTSSSNSSMSISSKPYSLTGSSSSSSEPNHRITDTDVSPPIPAVLSSQLGKTNEELRQEARERRKGIEGLERRARARRERSLVNKREGTGERRRSSFYGFYDTLLGRDGRVARRDPSDGGFI
ncbi:MAG: hypothetical protein M1835_005159 [Candelina submexicana]|nr:MAG: hypothetical protein M1835_005159 [Candelina submexicana]